MLLLLTYPCSYLAKQRMTQFGAYTTLPWQWRSIFCCFTEKVRMTNTSLSSWESVPILQISGKMVTRGSQAPHQHPRAQSEEDGSAPVDPTPPSAGMPNQGAIRQYHRSGLHRSPRGHQDSFRLEVSKPYRLMDGETLSSDLCCPHPRSGQLKAELP